MNYQFKYLYKPEFSIVCKELFSVLADNMTLIAPTGNSREEDFLLWSDSLATALQNSEREIVIVTDNENIIGYFQYSISDKTFKMEEIQFKSDYQGKGIFRELYGFALKNIRMDLESVVAFASINNYKSIGILEKMGLSNTGFNKNGRSYRFEGRFVDFIKWYECK